MQRNWPYVWNGHRAIKTQGLKAKYSYGWGPTRIIGFPTLLERIVIAWKVFTGEFDAVTWKEPTQTHHDCTTCTKKRAEEKNDGSK